MKHISIYGIKNCDTMKKALKWLDANNVDYLLHDYKKDGADKSVIEKAINEHSWENVLNRRGTTWRKLPEEVKSTMDDNLALGIALKNPSIIKRPLLATEEVIYLGFNADLYKEIFS